MSKKFTAIYFSVILIHPELFAQPWCKLATNQRRSYYTYVKYIFRGTIQSRMNCHWKDVYGCATLLFAMPEWLGCIHLVQRILAKHCIIQIRQLPTINRPNLGSDYFLLYPTLKSRLKCWCDYEELCHGSWCINY